MFGRQVDLGSPINWSSPLCRGLRLWYHFGHPFASNKTGINGTTAYDLTRRPYANAILGNDPTWTGVTQKPGIPGAMVFDETNDHLQVVGPSDAIFNVADAMTMLIVRRKQDTTARASAVCGTTADVAPYSERFWFSAPFSDGTVYFDWGGATEGASRISSAWTADTAWHWWAVTVGGGLGMRIYKDGALFASNAGTPSRDVTSGDAWWINLGTFEQGDLCDIAEVVCFNRALTAGEVREWMKQSKDGHPDTMNTYSRRNLLFSPTAAAAGEDMAFNVAPTRYRPRPKAVAY